MLDLEHWTLNVYTLRGSATSTVVGPGVCSLAVERVDVPVRPESEWLVTRDAHPALIARDLFDRVQARLAENRKRSDGRAVATRCRGSYGARTGGHSYIGGGGNRNTRDPSDPDRYRFYRDSGSPFEREVCPGRLGTVSKRWVEPAVIDAIA